ncbi:sugar ABC transporter permease [Luteimicrobium album]|uniref:Sugar ABC transporter permease n=1 Tax=Luteimicrobium album TaxID=1054550 RepID=A0ABQ6HVP6_9MICO|nr:sugar ABC transporter permease [Luteimicrobium album]
MTTTAPRHVVADRPTDEAAQTRRRRGALIRAVPRWLVTLLAAAIVLPPVAWVLSTSLKRDADTVSFPPRWIPNPFSWAQYEGIYTITNVRFLINSTVLAVGSIVLALVICVPAAYAATRFRSGRTEALMTVVLVLTMVPGIVVFIALYAMLVRTSLINTYPLLIVVYTALISGQAILFLRNFFENIPVEIEEAAAIDGCNRRQILLRVVLPLVRPGIAAIAVFIFVFVWNDFLVSTVLATSEDMKTVQNGIVRYITTGFGNFWGLFAAFVIVSFAPVLAVFVAFQRWFIAGMTSGESRDERDLSSATGRARRRRRSVRVGRVQAARGVPGGRGSCHGDRGRGPASGRPRTSTRSPGSPRRRARAG